MHWATIDITTAITIRSTVLTSAQEICAQQDAARGPVSPADIELPVTTYPTNNSASDNDSP
jgi:hypothetical protein